MGDLNAEKFQNLIFYRYRYAVAYILMVVVSIGTLGYRLDDLLMGLSDSEVEQGLAVTQDSTTILEQGVYLPYNVVQTISADVLGESALALRLPSVLFAGLTLLLIFILVHIWHREKIAIITVMFLATSSWFLTFARLGAPYIYAAFSLTLLFLCGSLLRHSSHPRKSLAFAAIALPLALYSPLLIYLFALFALLYRKEIADIISSFNRSNLVAIGIVGASLMAPLIYGFIVDIDNLKEWLGITQGLPSIQDFFNNILSSVEHILWNSQSNAELHLANLAMLDIFTATMAALGLYHYEQHFKWLRTRFLIYGLGILLLLFGLSTSEGSYFIAAPIIYLFAATGIITLLNLWNRIFPVNPFARTLALLPLALALLVTGQYHLDRYFSAWALSPNTRKVYAIEPALLEDRVEADGRERVLIVTREEEHPALAYLLNDAQTNRQIDVINPEEGARLSNFAAKYDVVYVDGEVSGGIKTKLDNYISETIRNDRESRTVAYRIYDLSTKVSLTSQ